MINFSLILTVAILPNTFLNLSHHEEVKGNITLFGLFGPGEVIGTEKRIETPTGVVKKISGAELYRVTKTVPLEIGREFGFCYELTGFKNDVEVEIQWIVKHPLMVKPNGDRSIGYQYSRVLPVENGKAERCPSYKFEHQWELREGNWGFAVEYKGNRLVNIVFEAVNHSPQP